MASIKLKFRPSTVKGKEGTLYFQIIHQRKVRQIYTELHIMDDEWDGQDVSIPIPSDSDSHRVRYLTEIKETVMELQAKLSAIISDYEHKGFPYDAEDVVRDFSNPNFVVGIVSFMRKLIGDMNGIGKRSLARRLSVSLNSLLRYTEGKEIEWKEITSTFILGLRGIPHKTRSVP